MERILGPARTCACVQPALSETKGVLNMIIFANLLMKKVSSEIKVLEAV
jgi:hypothetical protein